MRVYVAAHERHLAHGAAESLIVYGFQVTSRWHSKEFLPTSRHTESECIAIAVEDFDDITSAESLVLISGPEKYSGGKFVEAGIALGQGKPVFVIGRRENMLMWHPHILAFDTLNEFISFIINQSA